MVSNGETAQRMFSKRLIGKVAVITGGARGIGAATSKLLAENGAYVIIADILDELGAKLADLIGGRYVHCDVSKEYDVEHAIQFALKWKGRIDIMFNNAGVAGPEGSITNLNMDDLRALIDINLNGVVHGIKHAARAMIEAKTGGEVDEGQIVHGFVEKIGIKKDVIVCNGLLSMYFKVDRLTECWRIFYEMVVKDTVTWNTMICGYSESGLYRESIRVIECIEFSTPQAPIG
ncbi:unnamed protein product [Fraxinus pennsylvanica]|uniref:Uncharacterized protein n=1 Tax=Fraxinus pennsylvanica TaxID=56036 RepID=A0AAD1Z8N8_9LAMI|nr:unnamed protein product [Fraxinus pennsylvanica]